jgi:flavin-dependent dehydrogenase
VSEHPVVVVGAGPADLAAALSVRGLEPLVGHLDVLDEHGAPRVLAPLPAAYGLRFLGFLSRPSLIGYVAKQSRRMAKNVANELR